MPAENKHEVFTSCPSIFTRIEECVAKINQAESQAFLKPSCSKFNACCSSHLFSFFHALSFPPTEPVENRCKCETNDRFYGTKTAVCVVSHKARFSRLGRYQSSDAKSQKDREEQSVASHSFALGSAVDHRTIKRVLCNPTRIFTSRSIALEWRRVENNFARSRGLRKIKDKSLRWQTMK